MTSTTTRRERRAVLSQAAKLYGVKGEAAISIHNAYRAIEADKPQIAAQEIAPVIQSHPESVHPWLILGKLALSEANGPHALEFYKKAAEIEPRNPSVHNGIANAILIQKKPFESIGHYERAMELGLSDLQTVKIYRDLMTRMGRSLDAAKLLRKVTNNTKEPSVLWEIAESLLGAEMFEGAIDCYERIRKHGKGTKLSERALLMQNYLENKHQAVINTISNMPKPIPEELVPVILNSLRSTGKYSEALAYLDNYDFEHPAYYQRSMLICANVHRDLDQDDEAISLYEEAMHLSEESKHTVASLLGAYKLRHRVLPEGAEIYSGRFKPADRNKAPFDNARESNLKSLERVFFIQEQGVGDQIAFLPLAAYAAKSLGIPEVSYVAEQRFADMIQETSIGVKPITPEQLVSLQVPKTETVQVGDMTLYLDQVIADEKALGGYIIPDQDATSRLRAKYEKKAKGRPIIGISWFSKGALAGHSRTISLEDIIAELPSDALIINLQYGDHEKEISKARKAFKNHDIFSDREVDQLSDMRTYCAQLAAMDTIVTIDNTTAHVCGAIGHKDAHMLLPTGGDRYWFWGPRGDVDPWYGVLKVHSQETARDWSSALQKLGQALRK